MPSPTSPSARSEVRVALLGMSGGASTAIDCAVRHPERVERK